VCRAGDDGRGVPVSYAVTYLRVHRGRPEDLSSGVSFGFRAVTAAGEDEAAELVRCVDLDLLRARRMARVLAGFGLASDLPEIASWTAAGAGRGIRALVAAGQPGGDADPRLARVLDVARVYGAAGGDLAGAAVRAGVTPWTVGTGFAPQPVVAVMATAAVRGEIPVRQDGCRLLASIDVEWTKNYKVRDGNVPFCWSVTWLGIPVSPGTRPPAVPEDFAFTSSYVIASAETGALIADADTQLAAVLRHAEVITGHQLCSDLAVLRNASSTVPARPATDRSRRRGRAGGGKYTSGTGGDGTAAASGGRTAGPGRFCTAAPLLPRPDRGDGLCAAGRSRRAPAAGRRPRTCPHLPACPPPRARDYLAARVIAGHPEQCWSLLCNGVVAFEDTGVLPGGSVIEPSWGWQAGAAGPHATWARPDGGPRAGWVVPVKVGCTDGGSPPRPCRPLASCGTPATVGDVVRLYRQGWPGEIGGPGAHGISEIDAAWSSPGSSSTAAPPCGSSRVRRPRRRLWPSAGTALGSPLRRAAAESVRYPGQAR